jgi:hypothetical protein
MAHPLKHAESSAKKFGGQAEDSLAVHKWFDESKRFSRTFATVPSATTPREFS